MTNPKKSLGQHWLTNQYWLEKMAEAAEIEPQDTVLEIGPGQGTLTDTLLKKPGRVVAIEKDHRLIPVLKEKFASELNRGQLKLISGDILDLNPKELGTSDLKVVANIPYYLTGKILSGLLSGDPKPKTMVLMIQKEVARRCLGEPATKNKHAQNNLLSISISAYGQIKYLATVKRGNFSPPPKIDSAIIKIDHIDRQKFVSSGVPEDLFFQTLKTGFGQKRKLLSKNLACPPEVLSECAIPEKARAENLSLEEWFLLAKKLNDFQNKK